MDDEAQYTTIIMMCGNPPAKRPPAFWNGIPDYNWVEQPYDVKKKWKDWAWKARACAVKYGFIMEWGCDEWSESFVPQLLAWFDNELQSRKQIS